MNKLSKKNVFSTTNFPNFIHSVKYISSHEARETAGDLISDGGGHQILSFQAFERQLRLSRVQLCKLAPFSRPPKGGDT